MEMKTYGILSQEKTTNLMSMYYRGTFSYSYHKSCAAAHGFFVVRFFREVVSQSEWKEGNPL